MLPLHHPAPRERSIGGAPILVSSTRGAFSAEPGRFDYPAMEMASEELSTTSPTMDSVLAKDYPSPIRELYTGVLREDRPSERHHQLLRLGETSLSYLAALAFADYRRLRGDDPVSEVEAAVGAMDRATAGDYMSLFRVSQRTLGERRSSGSGDMR